MRKNFGKRHQVSIKDSYKSTVTESDLASQEAIIKIIKNRFPSHKIYSEEQENIIKTLPEFLWVIDPLDGTTNFSIGSRFFCVSIALLYKGEAVAAAILAPMFDELFTAEKNKGAFLNGEKIRVSDKTALKEAVVCYDWDYFIEKTSKEGFTNCMYQLVPKTRKVISYGSIALASSYVAAGIFDASFNPFCYPWDNAAACLIVKEAGGKATTFDGKRQIGLTKSILATNGKLHHKLVRILSGGV